MSLAIGLQQTQAIVYLEQGFPPLPQHIDLEPDLFNRFAYALRSTLGNWMRVMAARSEKGAIDTPPPAPEPTGTPYHWQVPDPISPWNVVNLVNGNNFAAIPIASWRGMNFTLYHNCQGDTGVPALDGDGWSHSFSDRLDIDGDDVTYTAGDGRIIEFILSDGKAENTVYNLKLEYIDNQKPAYYVLTDYGQNSMWFDESGVLQFVKDSSGNQTSVYYNSGKLTSIVNQAGLTLTLQYDNSDRIEHITLEPLENDFVSAGGATQYELQRIADLAYSGGKLQKIYSLIRPVCEPDLGEPAHKSPYWIQVAYVESSQCLASITDYGDGGKDEVNDHHTWSFDYSSEKLTKVTKPEVFDYITDTEEAYTREYAYTTNSGDKITTVTNEREDDTVYTFDASERLESVVDPLSRIVLAMTWNDDNRPLTLTNVLGGVTTFAYTPSGGGEIIEVEGPQTGADPPVTITLDELKRITQITDPLEQNLNFDYGDGENPMRFTSLRGDEVNDVANFCWTQLGQSSGDDPYGGLIEGAASPNQTGQAYYYDPFGNLRYWENPVTYVEGACSSIPAVPPEQEQGGEGPSDACCHRGKNFYVHQKTGELRVKGGPSGGGSCCPNSAPVEESCSYNPATTSCGSSGCKRTHDANGNTRQLFGHGELYSQPSDSSACDKALESANDFVYDSNNHLVAAAGTRNGIKYDIAYDALGRMTEYYVGLGIAEEVGTVGMIRWPEYYHLVMSPQYTVDFKFSDSTGKTKIVYKRKSQNAPSNPTIETERQINTIYTTDAAGRVTEVKRDDLSTTYSYSDSGNPAVPNIIETRPDGAKSYYYLNDAGELVRIAHTRPGQSGEEVVADFKVLERDANRRILEIEENVLDAGAQDGLRTEFLTFEYGSGNIPSTDDLDDELNAINFNRPYYKLLNEAELNDGIALSPGDPNRLVRETRALDPEEKYEGSAEVEYNKQYFYDLGGNRLARVERDAEANIRVVTRYNYFSDDYFGSLSAVLPPLTPSLIGIEWQDYQGRGREMLISTQKFILDAEEEIEKVETVEYAYSADDLGPVNKLLQRYVPDGQEWNLELVENTAYVYRYDRLVSTDYSYNTYDPDTGDPLDSGETGEMHVYDELMGRRIATAHVPGGLEAMEGQKGDVIMYDYVGLSQQLLAARNTPWRLIGESWEYQGDDPILSSFTHGVTGIPVRTDEGGDTVTQYDVQYDILPDLFGGTTGVMTEGNQTLTPTFQHFDAFGVRLTDAISGSGPSVTGDVYRWRSQEGSETGEYEAETHPAGGGRYGVSLIYMQTRDYDPETGRFLTPDALYISSLTTQGMNRYIYCNNDPINFSDPTGQLAIADDAFALALILIAFMLLFSLLIAPSPQNFGGGGCNHMGTKSAQDAYPKPPGWNKSWRWEPPSGDSNGNWRWFDPKGGEWRWHTPDKYHPKGHWDYNPWTEWNSEWINIFIGCTYDERHEHKVAARLLHCQRRTPHYDRRTVALRLRVASESLSTTQ